MGYNNNVIVHILAIALKSKKIIVQRIKHTESCDTLRNTNKFSSSGSGKETQETSIPAVLNHGHTTQTLQTPI